MAKPIEHTYRGVEIDSGTNVVEAHGIDVLLDRTSFELDADKYDAFVAALDSPPSASPALKALMERPSPWRK